MNRLKLILPDLEHENIIMDYKREFIENKDSMDGSANLINTDNFKLWYELIKDNRKEETVRNGFVPSTTYIALNSHGKLIGMVDIRHRLNDYLLKFGGNIGYSIRKSERRKGYATEMLGLALKECEKLNIKKILITCNQNNIASAKTIIKNGGELENEVLNDDRITQRYWILIK